MSRSKSTNWSLVWRRSIWTLVWAAMMALLVVMCIDLAANQPVIFGIVMLAAFVGSIGLAYTRVSWQNGAKATAGAALVVSLLAIATHAFMEASYWSSVIDQINQEVLSERAVSDARAAVAAKRKERYVSSSNGRSAGQIEAELKAAETSVLFARSASCTTPTVKESREFCQSYFLLQSKLAAAKEAGQLEGVIWSAGTTVEGTTKRNLAAIAVLAANLFGGAPEQYTAIIVFTLVAFTQALLAFALVIGWAPEKAREASGAGFQKPVSLAGSFADPAYSATYGAPRKALPVHEKISGSKLADISAMMKEAEESLKKETGIADVFTDASKNSPEPGGPGTPAPAPKPEPEPKFEDVLTDNVIDATNAFRDTNPKATWKIASKAEKREQRKKTKKERKNPGEVKDFIRECLVMDKSSTEELTGDQIHDAYSDWCDTYGYGILGKGSVSGAVARHFQLPHCREPGARGKHGRKFPGISFKRQQLRKTA